MHELVTNVGTLHVGAHMIIRFDSARTDVGTLHVDVHMYIERGNGIGQEREREREIW